MVPAWPEPPSATRVGGGRRCAYGTEAFCARYCCCGAFGLELLAERYLIGRSLSALKPTLPSLGHGEARNGLVIHRLQTRAGCANRMLPKDPLGSMGLQPLVSSGVETPQFEGVGQLHSFCPILAEA
jgi:hypothetical protein